jgi:hypothetical protein
MMGDDDARFLVNLMRKKPHLTTLCGITDKMKSLDLSNQDLVDADAILLANEIQLNSTLSTVNILGNTFSCGPALKLVDAMKTNPNLMTLCGIKGNLPELQIPKGKRSCALGIRLSPGCAILLANEIEDRDRIVLIKDLKNAKHLNGLSGKVQRVLDNSNCKVLLANGESKSIKPANLEMQRAMLLSADLSRRLVSEEYISDAEAELGKFTLGDLMCWQGKQGVLVRGGSWFFEITGASALIDALPTHLTSLDVSKNTLVSNLRIKLVITQALSTKGGGMCRCKKAVETSGHMPHKCQCDAHSLNGFCFVFGTLYRIRMTTFVLHTKSQVRRLAVEIRRLPPGVPVPRCASSGCAGSSCEWLHPLCS